MYELNKRAVHPPHRLLWGHWERVSAVAWGGVREEDWCPRNGIMERGEVSQGTFWLPLLSFREVSKECGLMLMGGLVGCPRDLRALLGDRSRAYCWSHVLCIVGDTSGCFEGF